MQYVLLNETGYANHQGCRTVSRTITTQMRARGFNLAAAERGGAKWWKNASFVRAAQSADVILINGEGTMHSGGRAAGNIMRFVAEHDGNGPPIAFINSIWERNPVEWLELMKGLDLVSVRDKASQQELAAQGVQARFVPDLSLSAYPSAASKDDRVGIGWCDSVNKQAAAMLKQLAGNRRESFLPVQSSHRHLDYRPGSSLRQFSDAAFYRLRSFLKFRTIPDFRLFKTPEDYFHAIASLDLLVTGRFHGACLAILAGVPFVALSSNTRKIEQLIDDAGLERRRVVPLDQLEDVINTTDWSFSEQEEQNRQSFLTLAQKGSDQLFDDISGLVTTNSKPAGSLPMSA